MEAVHCTGRSATTHAYYYSLNLVPWASQLLCFSVAFYWSLVSLLTWVQDRKGSVHGQTTYLRNSITDATKQL